MADAGLERTGVEAVTEGVDTFVKNLERMNKAMETTRTSTSSVASGSTLMSDAMNALSAKTVALGTFVGGLALKIGEGLVGAISSAIGSLEKIGSGALIAAGNFTEARYAALAVGQAFGYTQAEVNTAIKDFENVGITAEAAAGAITFLTQNQADLTRATELGNIATGMSVIGHNTSTEAMEALTMAITTGQARALKQRYGLVVDMGKAEDRLASSLGKEKSALTEQEVVQARLNAVLERGAGLSKIYADAAELPTVALRKLTGTLREELLESMGAPFQNAFSTVIIAVSNFVKSLTAAISEGGALYPIMLNLGAVASLVADGFAALTETAAISVENFSTGFLGGLSDTAVGAFQWGVEIVSQLALGLVQGAVAALTTAMTVIGGLLSSWLSVGSDPKIAPMSVWGGQAMTEYLKGFEDADFDVLEGLQGTLKGILSGPDFANISKGMIEAIGGGINRESFFSDLAAATSQFGSEITDLARKQFALYDATRAVTDAEKKYSDAQKTVETGQAKVSSLTAEYNKMLRSGASKQALATKLKEINAAEDGVFLAQKQQAEAKTGVDTAKERADALKEQVSLQERLIKQITDMSKAMETTVSVKLDEDQLKKLKASGGTMTPPEMKFPAGFSDKISDKMKETIDNVKEEIKGKLSEIFSPLTMAIPKIVEALQPLGSAWVTFSGILGRVGEAIKVKIIGAFDAIKAWFTTNWPVIQAAALTAWTVIGSVVGAVVDTLVNVTWPTLKAALDTLGETLSSFGISWGDVWNATVTAVAIVAAAIGAIVLGLVGAVTGLLNGMAYALQGLVEGWRNFVTGVQGMVEGFITYFTGVWEFINGILTGNWPRALNGLKAEWAGAVQFITSTVQVLSNALMTAFNTIGGFIYGFVEGVVRFFQSLYDRLVGGSIIPELAEAAISYFTLITDTITKLITTAGTLLIDSFNTLKTYMSDILGPYLSWFKDNILMPFKGALDFIGSAVAGLIDWIDELKQKLGSIKLPAALTPGSPTPFELGLRGIADAMDEISSSKMPNLQYGLRGASPVLGGGRSAAIPTAPQQQIYRSNPVQIGPNYIGGGMDMAALQITVERVLRQSVMG